MEWDRGYPHGLSDERDKTEEWFVGRKLEAHLTFHDAVDVGGLSKYLGA